MGRWTSASAAALLAQSTGKRIRFDYVNPAAKPPAVRRVVTILSRGVRYDPSVPGSCTASDAELMLQGAEACPPDSAIGGGVITVDTGLPANPCERGGR